MKNICTNGWKIYLFYSFHCQSLIQQLAAVIQLRCHRSTIIFISMALHLKFTAFIESYIHVVTLPIWAIQHYFGTLFRSIIFAPALPFPASLQQIVNHHNWCLFIILYIFHNATDFVNSQLTFRRENCTWRKFLNMFCIILHIYILTEQSPEYHLQNMHSFWKLLKSCRAKKSFGTLFILLTLRKASLEWDNP